jgi:hypothetical protein
MTTYDTVVFQQLVHVYLDTIAKYSPTTIYMYMLLQNLTNNLFLVLQTRGRSDQIPNFHIPHRYK